jgi:putative inorganic carbon (HCO3(-)) transporter
VAFVVLIVLSPFRARIDLVTERAVPVYGDYTDFLLFVSDLAALATLGLWLLSLALQRRRVWFGPAFLALPVAVLLAVAWLGVPFAEDVPLAAYTALRFVALAALAVYVVNEVDRLDRIVAPVAAMIIVQAIVGIGQVVGQSSVGLSWLGEYDLSPDLGVSVITASDGTRILRAYGLADHPNMLAGVLAMALIIVAGALATRPTVGPSWRLVAFVLGTATLLLTFSRGAWFALVVGLVVMAGMLAFQREHASLRRLGIACGVGLIAGAPFLAPYADALDARTDGSGAIATEARSVDERAAVYEETTKVVVANPGLGVGIGTLPLALRERDPAFRYPYQPASVVLLDVTAETGLVGGAAYLVIAVAPWVVLLRRRRWTPDLAIASGALAALTVVGLFDYYTWTYSAGRIWAWVVLGLWAVAYRSSRPERARELEPADAH